jgi:hypothetical protein
MGTPSAQPIQELACRLACRFSPKGDALPGLLPTLVPELPTVGPDPKSAATPSSTDVPYFFSGELGLLVGRLSADAASRTHCLTL